MNNNALSTIIAYHEASKHRLDGYAPGPGNLDWVNQPDPFRRYAGTQLCKLSLRAAPLQTPFSEVRSGRRQTLAAINLANLATLLELSLGLSAWKEYGGSRWALRCNPSSGNLHPTECYVLAAARDGLASGVHHYVSYDHALERRAEADSDWGSEFADGFVLVLTSIHWREAWKYGLRAYRYCQHDCGHALAAVSYAAATLGWRAQVLENWHDVVLAALTGVARTGEFAEHESEAVDVALWIGCGNAPKLLYTAQTAAALASGLNFVGQANHLSARHVHWAGIDAVHLAAERPVPHSSSLTLSTQWPPLAVIDCLQNADALIRQRRSAMGFDGVSAMPAERWFTILDALLPRPGLPPWEIWQRLPRVHLILFVHRVIGVTPGVYLLLRDKSVMSALRQAIREDADWAEVPGAPRHLGLFRLFAGDVRDTARLISCHQDIAADSCFSLGMLAEFETALNEGAWHYRELFHEAGMIGQVLYLEAEAAGLRGTGIGCYFDDALHSMLGLSGHAWQSLYHFTVGGALDDSRLRTLPPYAHLSGRKNY
ncbi:MULTISPECIES: SagB/ThcOx family dehydrogenase [Nitrosomonas]|uniref:Nitroreductase n=1 Tax=Nitrosomonas communis TaxID=44574 RepID=A0A0F7KFS7_9PROT|nr:MULTISPECIES: SagB/ThcOx family dehydrogenase [Nitrosomonas]AKH37704.1 nitroreductase [Nitrosomonas communis]TYP87311.1 SagB-type dehydrogenase family enzyme [Nitrosomonas communis]UVS63013.1 SagB/ThcOx family dehydrogenase [Nitrosomonas sp. PLL12]